MAKYIHISQLGNSKRLCGGYSYSINHAFTHTATCPRCLAIAKKHPELTHYDQPFKDRNDFLAYMTELRHNKTSKHDKKDAAPKGEEGYMQKFSYRMVFPGVCEVHDPESPDEKVRLNLKGAVDRIEMIKSQRRFYLTQEAFDAQVSKYEGAVAFLQRPGKEETR